MTGTVPTPPAIPGGGPTGAGRDARPDVILITADQWRGECLSVLGHPVARTPNIDAVAAEGAVFANHFAAAAPCAPARASLYTGLHQMNHRVVWNGTPLDARFDNVALAARRAGYLPTLFGYTDTAPDPRHLHPNDPARETYEGVLPGFVQRQPLPEDDRPWLSWLKARGHDVSMGPMIHRVAPEAGERVSRAPTAYGADETQTAFLTDAFLTWLEEQAADRPLFAHVSYLRPHPPFAVPAPYNALFDPEDGPDPQRLATPAEEAALHPFVAMAQPYQKLSHFLPGAEGLARDLTLRDARRLRAIYWGMMAEVDAQIGRLVAGLKAAGRWENTLLVFTSDHGEMMGDRWMLGKGGFFEQSYRIPLVIKAPGGAKGVRTEAFTSAVDVFPTLARAMGVAPAHAPDGRALAPFLEGHAPSRWRDAAIWEFDFRALMRKAPGLSLPPEDCAMICRRDARSLYVHSPALPTAWFDLREDPGITRNLAGDPSRAAQRLAAAEALLTERTRRLDATLADRLVWER